MGASITLDQVWDAIDATVDAAGRVAVRVRNTLANAQRVANAYRASSVPSSPSDAAVAEIVEEKTATSRFFVVRRRDGVFVVTDGKNASATCPSHDSATQLLGLIRQLEESEKEKVA